MYIFTINQIGTDNWVANYHYHSNHISTIRQEKYNTCVRGAVYYYGVLCNRLTDLNLSSHITEKGILIS